jgi:hypothetical protein
MSRRSGSLRYFVAAWCRVRQFLDALVAQRGEVFRDRIVRRVARGHVAEAVGIIDKPAALAGGKVGAPGMARYPPSI